VPDPHDQLAKAVSSLERTIDKLRDELVRKDVYTAEREADRAEVTTLRDSVAKIEGTLTWLSRTLVASLLLPLASTIIIVYVLKQGG